MPRSALRMIAFASPFGSPLLSTPWILIREVRYDTGPEPSYNSIAAASFWFLRPFHAISTCDHSVSGTFNSPIWGAFQRSLTLLIRYRS